MFKPLKFTLTLAAAALLAAGVLLSLAPVHAMAAEAAGPEATSLAAAAKLREGRDALAVQNLEVAQAAFAEAARLSPRDPRPWVGRSAVAQLRNKHAEAREQMNKAVSLAPNNPKVLHIQGQLLLDQQEFAASEAVLRKVLGLAPSQVDSRIALANALAGQGKAAPAREQLAEAAKAADGAGEQLQLGGGYLNAGEYESALAMFNKVLAGHENHGGAHIGKADALERLGRLDQAMASLLKGMELMPLSADLQVKLGLLHEQMKKPESAESAYREALRVDERSAVARNNLAYLLATRGIKLDEALQLAKRAVQLDPSAPMYDTLGTVHLARKEHAQARAALEYAVLKAPESDAYRQRLALTKANPRGNEGVALAVPPAPPTTTVAVAARPADLSTHLPAPAAGLASVPSPVPGLQEDARSAISSRMAQWESAWEAKDTDKYLQAYASSFKPDKFKSREAWASDRRKKLDKPGDIQVEIDEPAFAVAGDVVTVRFTQRYSSANYKDVTRKQLEWVKEEGEWRIRREVTL